MPNKHDREITNKIKNRLQPNQSIYMSYQSIKCLLPSMQFTSSVSKKGPGGFILFAPKQSRNSTDF